MTQKKYTDVLLLMMNHLTLILLKLLYNVQLQIYLELILRIEWILQAMVRKLWTYLNLDIKKDIATNLL